jgi:hypothetical protein
MEFVFAAQLRGVNLRTRRKRQLLESDFAKLERLAGLESKR